MKKIKKVLLFTHEKYQNNADIQKLLQFLKEEKIGYELLLQTVSEIKLNSTGEDLKLSSIRKKNLTKLVWAHHSIWWRWVIPFCLKSSKYFASYQF